MAAAALLGGTILAAQATPNGGGMQQSPPTQQPSMEGSPMTGSGEPNPQQMADQAFVKDTFENDMAQVQMSQLAQQKSPSNDVKRFSQQMAQVQAKLNDQLQPLAKQLNVSQPKGPGKKEKQEIAKLQALSGPDFDTAYLQAMAKQQQQILKEFKNESGAGQGSGAQQAARMDEPVLTQNFDILKKIAQAHNVTIENGK